MICFIYVSMLYPRSVYVKLVIIEVFLLSITKIMWFKMVPSDRQVEGVIR